MQAEGPLADRYELERRLASGGMGEVWLARDGVLGREVAVKVIAIGSDSDPEAVERFRREATMTAALEHPNIVTIFDTGTHHGSAFIVMELLAGPTLARLVADRGPLPEVEAVRLGAQIAAGLAAAHRAGVIHRDIKPTNLMFSSSGMLKILDFGIARLSQTTAPGLTATNAVIGSAPYLSPEQAVGAPADERSDLYSFGCVLMMMVTGRPPFTGEHPMAVLHQHVSADPPLLRDRQPGVSSALEALVGQLLNKRADARPASADEVEKQLSRIMTAREEAGLAATSTLLATAPPQTTRIEPAATRAYPTASLPPEIAGPRQREVRPAGSARMQPRSWWLISAAVVAAVILASVVLTPLLSRTGAGTSEPSAPGTPSILTTSKAPATSAPATSAPPKTTPQVSATGQPTSALANVRAVAEALVADGQMDPEAAKEFGHRLDDLAKKLDKRDRKDNRKDDGGDDGEQVADLSDYLSELVEEGELTSDGFRRIEAALARI